MVGLNHSANPKENIRLSFCPSQTGYLKSLPIHHSQQIIQADENQLIIEINVQPNFELNQQILKYGPLAKVISPAWYAKEIKSLLKEAFQQYKINMR